MFKRVSIAVGLAALLGFGSVAVMAGTPFGGDNTGTIPSDAPKGPVAKCESGIAKGLGKLTAGIIKCHISRVTGKLADETAEDACEDAAQLKFTSKAKTTGCPPCINLNTLAGAVEGLVDSNNSQAYC